MRTRFTYIHISDTHLCIEPSRINVLNLIERRARSALDTFGDVRKVLKQRRDYGLGSLAKPASYVPAILSGVAQFCLKYSRVVDGILVSGDIATTGLPVDLAAAHRFIADRAADGFLSEEGRPTISSGGRPIYLLPGNHDRYANNFAVTNSRTFDIVFDEYLTRQKVSGNIGYWVRQKNNSRLVFVTADFSLRSHRDATTRAHSYGQGRVYDDTLAALVKKTLDLKAKYVGAGIVWLIHFAPYDCGHTLRLHGWEKIPAAAAAAGVDVTLCGHTHAHKMEVANDHLILCAGSAGCVDSERRSMVHLVHIDFGSKIEVSRENFIWSATKKEFEWWSDDIKSRRDAL